MLRLGEKQKLICIKKEEFGVYMAEAMEAEEKVLLPIKQVPDSLKIGDELEVFIYRDSKDRIICTTNEPLITVGNPAVLTVADVGRNGAFVNCGLERDILLPFKEQTYRVKKGDQVLVALYLDKSNRLCTTMKVYNYMEKETPYKRDDKVTGFVYDISDRFGVYVAIDNKFSGRIPPREYDDRVEYGQVVSARVTRVLSDGKLDLSMKQKAYIQMDADAKLIFDLASKNGGVLKLNDKSSPEEIMSKTHLSKNAFKRAVGRLLKAGKINIEETGIRIVEKGE